MAFVRLRGLLILPKYDILHEHGEFQSSKPLDERLGRQAQDPSQNVVRISEDHHATPTFERPCHDLCGVVSRVSGEGRLVSQPAPSRTNLSNVGVRRRGVGILERTPSRAKDVGCVFQRALRTTVGAEEGKVRFGGKRTNGDDSNQPMGREPSLPRAEGGMERR